MEIHLHEFTSFFEFFAALNLGFAGSDSFKYGLSNVLGIDKTVNSLRLAEVIKRTESRIKLMENEIKVASKGFNGTEEKIKEDLELYNSDIKIYSETLQNISLIEKEKREFIKGFQSMFLLTGLYCLFLLLLEGYEQFYSINYKHGYSHCLLGSQTLIGVNFGFLLVSFMKGYNKDIKAIIIFIILSIIVFYSIRYGLELKNLENPVSINKQKLFISYAILAVISPYLVHLIRVWIHQINFRFLKIYFLRIGVKLLLKTTTNKLNITVEQIKNAITLNIEMNPFGNNDKLLKTIKNKLRDSIILGSYKLIKFINTYLFNTKFIVEK